jgi:hypothetical protein
MVIFLIEPVAIYETDDRSKLQLEARNVSEDRPEFFLKSLNYA